LTLTFLRFYVTGDATYVFTSTGGVISGVQSVMNQYEDPYLK